MTRLCFSRVINRSSFALPVRQPCGSPSTGVQNTDLNSLWIAVMMLLPCAHCLMISFCPHLSLFCSVHNTCGSPKAMNGNAFFSFKVSSFYNSKFLILRGHKIVKCLNFIALTFTLSVTWIPVYSANTLWAHSIGCFIYDACCSSSSAMSKPPFGQHPWAPSHTAVLPLKSAFSHLVLTDVPGLWWIKLLWYYRTLACSDFTLR